MKLGGSRGTDGSPAKRRGWEDKIMGGWMIKMAFNCTMTYVRFSEDPDVQLGLLITNLVLTFMTTVFMYTKLQARCLCAECRIRPSNAMASPAEVVAPRESEAMVAASRSEGV